MTDIVKWRVEDAGENFLLGKVMVLQLREVTRQPKERVIKEKPREVSIWDSDLAKSFCDTHTQSYDSRIFDPQHFMARIPVKGRLRTVFHIKNPPFFTVLKKPQNMSRAIADRIWASRGRDRSRSDRLKL
jgi:hypothetical protein